jgi:hypothetical protein
LDLRQAENYFSLIGEFPVAFLCVPVGILYILDVPLSAICDTLTLPVTISRSPD